MDKQDLEKEVILSARQYGISNVLFRHAVGEVLGVNATDMECLGLLFHKSIATPSELAKHTGLSSGSTTAMLDRLEKSGIIERHPNPKDRRGTLITINKQKTSELAPLFLSSRKKQNELVASYSEKELKILSDFFKKASALYEQERENLHKKLKGGDKK